MTAAPPAPYGAALKTAPRQGSGSGSLGLSPSETAMLRLLKQTLGAGSSDPYLAPTPTGTLDKQISSGVNSQIQPYLASIASKYAGETAGATQAIEGATKNYAAAVDPIAARQQAIADQETAQLGKESDALGTFLSNAGGSNDAAVSGKLAAADIAPGSQGVQGMGVGAAKASKAAGYADTADATTEGLNTAQLATLLPGFANLTGQQAENGMRTQLASEQASERAGVTQQVPGLISGLEQQAQQNETAKAGSRQSARSSAAGTVGSFLTSLLGNKDTDMNDAADRAAQEYIAQLSADTSTANAATSADASASAAAARAAKPVRFSSGGVEYTMDPSTGVASPIPGVAPPKPSTGSKQSAISHADSVASSVLAKAAKPAKAAASDPFGAGSTAGPTKPPVGGAAYNQAVNEAVTRLSSILGPYMSHEEIVRFVQERALHAGFAAAPKPAAPPPGNALDGSVFPR